MSPDEIEQALTAVDWNDTLNDRTAYRELTYRRKEDESRYLTAFEAGLRGKRLALPSRLQSGQKVRFLLQSNLLHVAHVRDFSQLPVPFKASPRTSRPGEAVVLGHGDLAEAIRASMSIPGVYSPMEIDGRLLVDGGIANNVPVDVVRAMGADVVIAVDVGGAMLECSCSTTARAKPSAARTSTRSFPSTRTSPSAAGGRRSSPAARAGRT